MTNGTRNQIGRIEARAPIGSIPIAVLSFGDDPARRIPKMSRMTGASDDPNVVQPTTPELFAVRGR